MKSGVALLAAVGVILAAGAGVLAGASRGESMKPADAVDAGSELVGSYCVVHLHTRIYDQPMTGSRSSHLSWIAGGLPAHREVTRAFGRVVHADETWVVVEQAGSNGKRSAWVPVSSIRAIDSMTKEAFEQLRF